MDGSNIKKIEPNSEEPIQKSPSREADPEDQINGKPDDRKMTKQLKKQKPERHNDIFTILCQNIT